MEWKIRIPTLVLTNPTGLWGVQNGVHVVFEDFGRPNGLLFEGIYDDNNWTYSQSDDGYSLASIETQPGHEAELRDLERSPAEPAPSVPSVPKVNIVDYLHSVRLWLVRPILSPTTDIA